MQLSSQLETLPHRQWVFVVFRVLAYVLIGILALLIPETGEHRFWLAGVVVLVVAPISTLLSVRFRSTESTWIDPLFDLNLVVMLVHLVPQMWVPAVCIGLMISLAPSVSLHPHSHRIYAGFAIYLISGMSLSGWMYSIENWWIVMLAVAVVYPSTIYYARWQVRRTDAMRARSQLMRNLHQLSGSVAHDFNNVLTGISGHTELALRNLPADNPARKDMLEVLAGVDRAGLLCNQMLSFSMQADTPQTLNLVAEIRSLARLLKSVVPKRVPIDVRASIDEIPVQIRRPEFQQVMMNLILNAGEAMSHRPGPILIEVSKFTRDGSAWARVTVADTGPGVSREDVDVTESSDLKPFGLGLANAQRVIHDHGGNVDIASESGRGTTVTLELPLTFESPDTEAPHEPVDGKGALALVVDDEPSIRDVTQRLLASMSFEVEVVESAEKAIDMLREKDYALLILDLDLPGEDGWWCLRELRKFAATLPVVIASGYDPKTTSMPRLTARETVLSKPFTKLGLERAVGLVTDTHDLNVAGVEDLVE